MTAQFAHAGASMSFGPSILDQFKHAAGYVDKILKGSKPSDLPVEQATRFELILNLKTAEALGLTFPARRPCAWALISMVKNRPRNRRGCQTLDRAPAQRLSRQRFSGVPGMFSSLEVKVLCAT